MASPFQDRVIDALMGISSGLQEKYVQFPWTLDEAVFIVDSAYQRIRSESVEGAIGNWKDWLLAMCQLAFDYAKGLDYSKESLRSVAILLYLIMQMPISVQTLVVSIINERWGDLLKKYESLFAEIEEEEFK